MKIFDKISWHTDDGENVSTHIDRFRVIFEYLNSHDMLSDNGKEIFELGIDQDASLNSKLLTDKGLRFCEKYEDMIVGIDAKSLKTLLKAADYEEYRDYVQNIISFILGYGNNYSADVAKDIYSTRDKINTDIQKLPASEVERQTVLSSLVDIVVGHLAIEKKLGKE